jgi:hypothetical protein
MRLQVCIQAKLSIYFLYLRVIDFLVEEPDILFNRVLQKEQFLRKKRDSPIKDYLPSPSLSFHISHKHLQERTTS